MAIREATSRVEGPAEAKPRPDRRRRRRDLRPRPFPTVGLEQWQDTETALTQLYRYAEGRAIEAIDWYLADKRGKRSWSRGPAPAGHRAGHRRRPPAPAGCCRPRAQPHRLGVRAAGHGRGLHRLRPLLRPVVGLDAVRDLRPGPGAPPGAAPVRLGGRAPAAPPAPSTPSRSRTAWPCCGSSPTTWRPCSSRRRPPGSWSSRAACCAWSARTRPGRARYHCTAPSSPEETPDMPTDHGPELEALRKRLADAKEFL